MSRSPVGTGHILPPRPLSNLGLALAVLLLTFFGAVAAILVASDARALAQSRAGGPPGVTVVVWAVGLESADAAAARAGEILSSVSGVVSATPLDPLPSDAAEGRIAGAPSGSDVRQVSVTPAAPGLPGRLALALAKNHLAGAVDDQSRRESPARHALWAALAGMAMLIAAVGIFSLCAVRTGAEAIAQGPVIDLIRLFGAEDGVIRSLVRRRIAAQAFIGTALGTGAAMIAVAVYSRLASEMAEVAPVARTDLLWAMVWMVLGPAVALAASGRSVGFGSGR